MGMRYSWHKAKIHGTWFGLSRLEEVRQVITLQFKAGLTESAGLRDFGKLKLPQRTEGCHKNVWNKTKNKGGEHYEYGTIFWTFFCALNLSTLRIKPHVDFSIVWVWSYMVRSMGLLWKALSGMAAISLLWNPLQEECQGTAIRCLSPIAG